MAMEELTWVRTELDVLVSMRSLVGLTPVEQVRYEALADREAELLQARRAELSLR